MSKRSERDSIRSGYFPSQDWQEVADWGGPSEVKTDPRLPNPTPNLKDIQNSGPTRPTNAVRVPEELL